MSRLKCAAPRLKPAKQGLAFPEKKAEPFYSTPEFREWRDLVIKRAGNACQGKNCGRTGVRLFADHIKEIRDGGEKLDLSNGQALCGSCHTLKTVAEKSRRHSNIRD
jgi:5-methylcytosine-specific restriction endonuclease McrA